MESIADQLLASAETQAERALLRRWFKEERNEAPSRASAWEALHERSLPRPRRYCW
ncbi:MAG: hypothetical protein AB8B93_06760 [Pseudomonadales bacterium]